MDWADFAQKSNEVYLDAALKTQLRKRDSRFDRLSDRVKRSCLDCGEEINPARLAANPEAVRCIDCQIKKEHKEQHEP